MRDGYVSGVYMIWGVRRAIRCHLKNPLNGFFEAAYLVTPDFEFGMTQAFSGQTDGTSRSGMARKPYNRGPWGFEEAELTPVVVSDSHDRAIIALRIAICHTWYDRPIFALRLACGAQRVLVDLLNAALCPERV